MTSRSNVVLLADERVKRELDRACGQPPDPVGDILRATEELTPEGVQYVIPGAEKRLPATAKQMELW